MNTTVNAIKAQFSRVLGDLPVVLNLREDDTNVGEVNVWALYIPTDRLQFKLSIKQESASLYKVCVARVGVNHVLSNQKEVEVNDGSLATLGDFFRTYNFALEF
jgi:hypothetical protein